jgi:ferredoxin
MSKQLKIDKDECIGCGLCELSLPEVFVLEEDIASIKKNPESITDKIQEVIDDCPVSAIKLEGDK